VVYNFRDGFLHDNRSNDRGFNIVGNYYKGGPSDPKIFPFCFQDGVRYYLRDNWIEGVGRIDDPWREADRHPGLKYYAGRGSAAAEEFAVAPVTTHAPREALALVLERAGCLPHDAITRRTVREVRDGTGAWGRGTGGLEAGSEEEMPPQDTDGDGIPDEWEAAHGLDPRESADSRRILASGYAAVEEYANERVADLLRRAAEAAGQ
jgi:hypothetical protein